MSLSITSINPPLTGNTLIEAIDKVKERRKPIVESLIYEHTILMVSADPGVGKSTIASQIAIEMAAGIPVFGVLQVPKPVKVLYVQTERDILEFLERLDLIKKVYPIAKENLAVTDEYQKLNMLIPDHAYILIKCIKRDFPQVEVIFIDPIYSMVSGGLKEDAPASAFTHAMSLVQKETGAALYYNHHTVKPQYVDGKLVERDDPFYGSTWLKAHATGAFYMKASENGVKMIRKKDNYKILPESLDLVYDPETGLSTIPNTEVPALERVRNFLYTKSIDGREFTFKDIETATQLCSRTVRGCLLHSSIKDLIFVVSSIKNKNYYKATAPKKGCAVQ